MRVAIVYPPYRKKGKAAFLPQNRQFIYSSAREVRLYPVVMAQAATVLKRADQTVFWLDGITEGLTEREFFRRLLAFKPDLVVTETKAPVVVKTWQFINKLKLKRLDLKVVLVGDQVTYYPEESFRNSKVDFVLTGGDYDFLLLSLVAHLEKGGRLEEGIWYRGSARREARDGKRKTANGNIKNTGRARLDHDLDSLPIIDRDLTRFWLYGEADVLSPCAYMMFGRGCGGVSGRPGACTFCIWQHCLWHSSVRLASPKRVVDEVSFLVKKYQVREIFDDTDGGACYNYQWLKEFFGLLRERGLLGRVSFSTNSRADVLDKKTCRLLKRAGFRMLKVGIESGSEATLKRIGKGETVKQLRWGVKNAKDAGLIVHLSAMVGYPWEGEAEVKKTFELMRELLFYKTRVGDSVQASVIVPYPGTPLWQEAKRKGWLIIKPTDYEKYDMSQSILKTQVDSSFWCKRIWGLHLEPVFLVKTALSIRSFEEVKFLIRGATSHFGHTKDYD
jgi:radical SAM superfamily enzyme YgiQ (UPF0313 family)